MSAESQHGKQKFPTFPVPLQSGHLPLVLPGTARYLIVGSGSWTGVAIVVVVLYSGFVGVVV